MHVWVTPCVFSLLEEEMSFVKTFSFSFLCVASPHGLSKHIVAHTSGREWWMETPCGLNFRTKEGKQEKPLWLPLDRGDGCFLRLWGCWESESLRGANFRQIWFNYAVQWNRWQHHRLSHSLCLCWKNTFVCPFLASSTICLDAVKSWLCSSGT